MVSYRSGRINEEMKRELSDIIQNEIRDPRLNAMISVTKVDVTKDLRYAKVFVSIFGSSPEDKTTAFNILKSSSGFLRREVGRRINLRHIPEITVYLDDTIEHGMHIDALLHQIKENNNDDK